MNPPVVLGLLGFLAGVSAIGLVRPAQTVPPPQGIRYLSAQRIITETLEGKAASAQFGALQQQRSADLAARQRVLEDTRQKLQAAPDAASRSQLASQESLQRAELEKLTTQYQTELASLQRQMQVDLNTKVRVIVTQIAKEQNLSLVLNAENALFWADPSGDITGTVVERLNAGAAPPQPAGQR